MAENLILLPLGDDGRLSDEARTKIEKNGQVISPGFITAVLKTSPTNRYLEAAGYVNGLRVAAATAADNAVSGVISSGEQSFTMPVPKGASVQVVANVKPGISVWWISL